MLHARKKPCQLTKFKFGRWRPVKKIEEVKNIFGTTETIVWYADNLDWDYIFNVEIKEKGVEQMERKIIFNMDNGGGFALELSEDEFNYLMKNQVIKIEAFSDTSHKTIYENLDPTITVHVGEQEFKKPEFEGIMNRMGFIYKKDYDFKTHLTLYGAAKELKDKGIKNPNIDEIKELRSKHLRPIAFNQSVTNFLSNLKRGILKK